MVDRWRDRTGREWKKGAKVFFHCYLSSGPLILPFLHTNSEEKRKKRLLLYLCGTDYYMSLKYPFSLFSQVHSALIIIRVYTMIYRNLNPKMMDCRNWAFRKWLDHEGSMHMDGIVVVNGPEGASLLFFPSAFCHVRTQQ